MHEVAKAPAVGMSVPQFRHGPVEAVHSEFRAVIFGTQPQTAELDLGLARDLIGMGARVLWLGPASNTPGLLTFHAWPQNVARRFLSILEVVPVQFLAYQTALANGIPPGKFRFALPVTTSETGFLS